MEVRIIEYEVEEWKQMTMEVRIMGYEAKEGKQTTMHIALDLLHSFWESIV